MTTISKLLTQKPETDLFKLSVSKAKTFKDCKAKYKYCYVEKLPRKEWEFQVFGKFIHEVLENFHKRLMEGCTDPYHILMNSCFKGSLMNYKITPEQKTEAFQILCKYLALLAKERDEGTASTCLSVEKDFYIEIDGKVLLNGFIDKVQLDVDGVLHVADYKTSSRADFLKKDWLQLLTYAYALYLEDPTLTKIRGSYIMLKLKKEDGTADEIQSVTRDFSIEEILAIGKTFKEFADQISAEKLFRPSTSKLCKYCDYLDLCDAGKNFIDKISFSHNLSKYGETSW